MTKILILDGGLGTSLEQNHNIEFGPTTPLWSSHLLISDPATLLQCQQAFGNVPVDILLTATYQVSIHGFANTKTSAEFPRGIEQAHIPQFLERAVQIAERATHKDAKVALSIGPYGACMVPSQEYSGKYDVDYDSGDGLLAWHLERLQLFAGIPHLKTRVGYLAIETIPRIDELIAIRRALDAVPVLSSRSVPFWMSCLFPNEDETLPDGNSPEQAVRAMLDPSFAKSIPWGVGINCTKVWKLSSVLQRYEAAIGDLLHGGLIREWPALVLYPDGTNGEVYNTTTKTWEVPEGTGREDRIRWEKQLEEVVKETEIRGSWSQIVVGGCCMSGPDDIQRLRGCLLKGSS